MSRDPLPKYRGKEKGKLASRDQVQGYTATRETKVDPIFENTDEQYQRGDEFSADEEPDPEEQLHRKIQKLKNKPSSSQDHQIKRITGERVQRTEEQDDGDDKNKVTDKKVAQKPQQEQVFTTAFKCQLGIILVLVFISLLAHYFLYSHLLHNIHVSESQQNSFSSKIDIDTKVEKVIKGKLDQSGFDKMLRDVLNNADIDGKVKGKIDNKLAEYDIDKKVKSSLESQAPQVIDDEAEKTIKTKLDQVNIDKKVQDALQNANIGGEVKQKIDNEWANLDSKVDLSLKKQAVDVILRETDNNPQLINLVESKVSEKIKSDIENLFNVALQEVQDKKVQLENWLDNNKELFPDINEFNDLKKSFQEISNKYSELLTAKTADSNSLGTLQKYVEEEKDNLKTMKDDFDKLQENILEATKQYKEHKDKIDKIREELAVIQPNTFNKENFMMAFMILTVIVCLLAVAVFNIYQRLKDTTPVGANGPLPANQPRKNMGDNEILRRLPRNPNLEPGICVISYDENRTNDHRKLLDSVNIPKCNVISHVIRRHQQILDLPRCKVYLMCTEFSERHVIIEEPGLGLGDLHRTTYGAVMKLGGSLIILYTKDPGSKHLKKDAMYNTNVYCVTKQPELSDLEKNGCFFSTYDDLTDIQKTELRKKIVENIN